MARGHVSLLANLDAWHSKPFRDIGHLLKYYQHSFRDLYKQVEVEGDYVGMGFVEKAMAKKAAKEKARSRDRPFPD